MSQENYSLYGCGGCECLFIYPPLRVEEAALLYPREYWWDPRKRGLLGRAEGMYRRLVLRDHVLFVLATARQIGRETRALRVLDVGCGNAALVGTLKERGFEVEGVDTSEDAAKIAADLYGVPVHVGRLEELQLVGGTFDIVMLLHVLEHQAEPRAMLAEARRLLRGDGRLIVQVPNAGSLQRRVLGARWRGLEAPRHAINHSTASLEVLARDCGFEVEQIGHFCLRDNAPALVSSLALGLDPLHRKARERRSGRRESPIGAWVKHLSYFFLVVCATPLTMIESLLGKGATVMASCRLR